MRFSLPDTYKSARVMLVAGAIAVYLTGCRQEMGNQPAYRPLTESQFFSDGRSERNPVPGTVARGHLRDDDALFTGKVNAKDVTEFPISITKEVLQRGQERFNIYCSPCHSKLGDGNGMIVQRGLNRPPSYHDDRLLTAPVGHFFDVISNGYGRMYSYDHIPVRDRWAIIAYVRALQFSQRATIADVPEADKKALMAEAGK